MAGWTAHDTALIGFCVGALLLIVLLVGVLRLTPFLAILLAAIAFGLGAGLPISTILQAFQTGAGAMLGEIGLVVALGAMLGGVLMRTGAANRLVDGLLRPFGTRTRLLPPALAAVAMLIGLPLFFEVGLVILLPVLFALVRRTGLPLVRIAVPVLAGLTVLHALVPPHPGPLIAIAALHADLGVTLGLGLLIALPAVMLAGPLYAALLDRLPAMRALVVPDDSPATAHAPAVTGTPPGFGVSLLVMLLPVALMLGRTLAETALPHDRLRAMLEAIGSPVAALLVSVLASIGLLGWRDGRDRAVVGDILSGALLPIAVLLLTIGAGGGLKQVLLSAGIGELVGRIAAGTALPLVLLAWLVSAALRQATGSATVATATTAGLLAPTLLADHATGTQTALVALSIGAGSVFFCHVNDAGFWMVNQFFRLTLKQTVLIWSLLQTIVSLVGLLLCELLWRLLG